MKSSRRSFLKRASVLSAAPFLLPSRIWSAETQPNDRLVMGFIGVGKQGRYLLRSFLSRKVCRVVAVCDVDTTRRDSAQQMVNDYYTQNPDAGSPDCAAFNDFRDLLAREDINAVCIATPDHWHTIPAIAALESGKDVYCEKPLTHNIHEAVALMASVEANRRVLQTGSMQRSSKEFRVACELVRNGVVGAISRVECSFGPPGVPCDLPEEEMEPGLDWDLWLGPAPLRPYHSILSPRGVHDHFPDWRNYREFGGGMVGDWGAHHLDIAQWGLDMDESGPVEVRPSDDPAAVDGGVLQYANGVQVIHMGGFGAHFYGSDGEVKVNRGKIELVLNGERVAGFVDRDSGGSLESTLQQLENEYLRDAQVRLYQSYDHIQDFLDCVKSRSKPITSEVVGGRSAICCHLLNQAYYNHATIKWQPERMQFAPGGGDPAWLTRNYRAPWNV